MVGLFQISDLISLVSWVKDGLTRRVDTEAEKRIQSIEAHKAINSAFIRTYDWLRKQQEGAYVPNIGLAEAWNEAASATMKVDKEFGEMLYQKSRFWLDPDLYINLGRENEIPELTRIIDEMGRLRRKL